MKSYLLLTIVLLVCACKNKQVCVEHKERTSAGIFFQGFNKSDISSLIVTRYGPDNTFRKILDGYTDTFSNIVDDQGVLYNSVIDSPFVRIDSRHDVEIIIPGTSKSYKLHLEYAQDSVVVYNAPKCEDHGYTMRPIMVYINSGPKYTGYYHDKTYIILTP